MDGKAAVYHQLPSAGVSVLALNECERCADYSTDSTFSGTEIPRPIQVRTLRLQVFTCGTQHMPAPLKLPQRSRPINGHGARQAMH